MEYYWETYGQRAPYVINEDGWMIFQTYPFVIQEMSLFVEYDWIKECGLIVYRENEHRFIPNEQNIADFFGLTNAEYFRYMMPYRHKKSNLHLHSTPKEVALGLYELIGIHKRTVLVEKFKFRNP